MGPAQELVELPKLIAMIHDCIDGAKHSLWYWRTAGHVGHEKNVFLDLRCEALHAHDLGHRGAGDTFQAGDVGLAGALKRSIPYVSFVSKILGSLRKSP
jgi:hypothetical protein